MQPEELPQEFKIEHNNNVLFAFEGVGWRGDQPKWQYQKHHGALKREFEHAYITS